MDTAQIRPQQTQIDQSDKIEAELVINEKTSKHDTPKQTHATAKKSYNECDVLSKKSLEVVSQTRIDDEVMLLIVNFDIFNRIRIKYYYKQTYYIDTINLSNVGYGNTQH